MDSQAVETEKPGYFEWRLSHGTESKFAELLEVLKSCKAFNIQLELTTLEEVFLETGREDLQEDCDDDPEATGVFTEDRDIEEDAKFDNLKKIWEPDCEKKPVSWWKKLVLVQNFMMTNALKIKGALFLNSFMPLGYLIAAIVLTVLFDADLDGEVIQPEPILINSELAGRNLSFFGVPMLDSNQTIAPLVPAVEPKTVHDYYTEDEVNFLGGYYADNQTIQYEPDLTTAFAFQIATMIISNYTAWLDGNSLVTGFSVKVQQLPFIMESTFRSDLLFIPFCLSFGFAGLAFSVLDVLLLKGKKVIDLFRVVGITEWTSYLGIMMYKSVTNFLPFFFLTTVLGLAVGLVLFGNAGRWMGSLLLMLSYAYSSTPMGLILAKRFIHGDYKKVAEWFPGVYFTFAGLPYLVYSSLLQALPESEELLLVVGDVLCVVPQFAFQRGLGAILEISDVRNDKDLSWSDVWNFKNRIWFTILLMCGVGTMEWFFLYSLTTAREAKTKLPEDKKEEYTTPKDVGGDPDIKRERQRSLVDSQGINARDIVKVFEVKDTKTNEKVFKHAVKGVSFGVRENEIFALVGPNGAGKSTTMSAFSGQITPEYGEVALDNVVIENDAVSVEQLFRNCSVAYVPQFDALFETQTVEEHLKFYAEIRGLDWKHKNTIEHVGAIIHLLGLQKHRKKNASELSGGYKRRLSLAISLLGSPKAILVDEVTTGLDPGARRLIWNVLKPGSSNGRNLKVPAILLSTHYMEEAEMLADHVGIMVDGQFAAAGTLNQLYERYCTSFFVEISLMPSAPDAAEEAIVDVFTEVGMPATVYESLPYHMKLQVPFKGDARDGDDIVQLANIFKLLEARKSLFSIKFYSVAKMNLEQIFINLSRKQFDADTKFESER